MMSGHNGFEDFRQFVGSQIGRLEGELRAHREFLFGNGHGGLVEKLARIDATLSKLSEWQEKRDERADEARRLAEQRRMKLLAAYITAGVMFLLTLAGWALTLIG